MLSIKFRNPEFLDFFQFWVSPLKSIGWKVGFFQFTWLYAEWDFRSKKKS